MNKTLGKDYTSLPQIDLSGFAKQLEEEARARQVPPQRLYAHPLRYPHVWCQILALVLTSTILVFSFSSHILFELVFYATAWAQIFGLILSCTADIRLISPSEKKPPEPVLTALQRRHGVKIVGGE